tara:strand:- start:93 stop:605 length:513 start_codon:yes stop_codon:yes gene_type:complete
MKIILKKCKQCNKNFNAPLREVKRGNGKFCSLKCSAKGRAKKAKIPNVTCAKCSKLFYKSPSKMKMSKSGLFFCNRLCKDSAQKIGGIKAIQPPHYGLGKGQHTYRKTALQSKPNVCNKCSYNKYTQILIVHHIDRDRKNNNLSNLEILCPNCHAIEHYLNNDGPWTNKK